MNLQRFVSVAVAAAIWSQSAAAGDVRLYRNGEVPDPRDVAAILAPQAKEQPIRLRSLRVLADPQPAQLAQAPQAAAAPAAAGEAKSLAIPVQFSFDSTRILGAAAAQLDAVAEGIKLAGPQVRVVIEGHTDAAGGDEYNLLLSFRRATAVKSYLVHHHGIMPANLKVMGLGETAPLNRENPRAPENRRVEFRAESA